MNPEETIHLLSNIFYISEKISLVSCVVIFILDKIEIYDEYDNNYEILQMSYIFHIIYLMLHGIVGYFYRNPLFTYLLINCILVNLINIYLFILLLKILKFLLSLFNERLKDKYYKINFNKSREIKNLNEEFKKYQAIKNENLKKINELQDRIDEIDFFIQDNNIWLNKINSVSYYIKQKDFNQAAIKMYLAGFSYYQRFNVDSLNSDFFYFLFQSTRLYYFGGNYEYANFLLGNMSKINKKISISISNKNFSCNTLFSFININDEGEKIRRGLLIGVMLIECHMEKRAIEVLIPCKNLLEKTIGSNNDIIRKLNTLIKNTYSDMDIVNYRFDDLTKTFLDTFNQFKLEQSLFMQKILKTLNDYKADVDSKFSQMDSKLGNLSSDLRSGLSTIDCNFNSLNKTIETNHSSMNKRFDSVNNKIDNNSQTIQSIYNKFY